MEATLLEWQCNVRTARSSKQAISLLNDFTPNIVLLDYHLHTHNGLQALEKIKKASSQPFATVIITGATEPSILDKIRQHNIVVLEKPVQANHLALALYQLIHAKNVG